MTVPLFLVIPGRRVSAGSGIQMQVGRMMLIPDSRLRRTPE
jgi:hypothetical protein